MGHIVDASLEKKRFGTRALQELLFLINHEEIKYNPSNISLESFGLLL